MPPVKAPSSYKKKDGSIVVSEDRKYVFWSPSDPPGSPPAVTIPVADVTNLQKTPATAKSAALKVFVKDGNSVFTFKDRGDLDAVSDTLSESIAASKAKDNALPRAAAPATTQVPAVNGAGTREKDAVEGRSAMAIAKAVTSRQADEDWYDDARLKGDLKLQKSLLDSNRTLQARFNQALRDKPESVSISQFTGQFWSARLHFLRAHAIETAQKQGEYNVLPEIRFVRKVAEKEGEEDVLMLNITKEQIMLIFRQYPVVREAYNENCPKPMAANEFWTRFFKSRLLKKLKGEKITQNDERDMILDRYLERPEGGKAADQTAYIPHWMDLEGNEQNHSQRKGNRPDEDMRPSDNDKAPILRVLNNLSEKMLAHVTPEDGEAHAPIGLDEETFEQLRLRDLANVDVDNRVVLNVQEQQRYAGGSRDDFSAEAKLYAAQDPTKVLSLLRSQLEPAHLGADEHGTLRLDRVIGYRSDEDSDEDDSDNDDSAAAAAPENPSRERNGTASHTKRKAKSAPRLGSHQAMTSASQRILSSIRQRRHAQTSDAAALRGLSPDTLDTLTMTHNTTVEFLHYFWTLFLSGDAARTAELAQLVSTLDKSLDRLNAVAAAAEAERRAQVDALLAEDKLYFERTKKRRKRDPNAVVGGGKKVVDAMVRPTVQALARATAAYRKAFEEQTRELQNGASGSAS